MLDRASVLLAYLPDAPTVLAAARRAETLGFRRVWLPETNTWDAAALGGAIAMSTSLEVGTAIVPVFSRSPALLAMTASTIASLGPGRPVHLGIGAGGQVTVERWHGVPFDDAVTVTADTIAIMRQALRGEKTAHEGKTRRSRGFRLSDGAASDVRIHVGGMGPKMQAMAARSADGLIVTWLAPRVVEKFSKNFTGLVTDAGRSRAEVELVTRAYVGVADDPAPIREAVRQELVQYLISPPYGNYFRSVGFDDEVNRVNEAFARKDLPGATAGVSDALLDEVLITGRSASDVSKRLRAYFDAGADHLMVQCVAADRGGDPLRTMEAVATALS